MADEHLQPDNVSRAHGRTTKALFSPPRARDFSRENQLSFPGSLPVQPTLRVHRLPKCRASLLSLPPCWPKRGPARGRLETTKVQQRLRLLYKILAGAVVPVGFFAVVDVRQFLVSGAASAQVLWQLKRQLEVQEVARLTQQPLARAFRKSEGIWG